SFYRASTAVSPASMAQVVSRFELGGAFFAQAREETAALLAPCSLLPEELRPAYAPLLQEEGREVERIVKAADKLSAYIKCLEELEAGNNEFGDAATETLEALRSMEMEEVAWFLDHFAEAFGLTLDGLQRG
ncbi:MAG: HD domain-containing protein, partial [Oscillospiraceae bacterium]|nr:HD domain-containing protein [Oscillospiraceae bacterium]